MGTTITLGGGGAEERDFCADEARGKGGADDSRGATMKIFL